MFGILLTLLGTLCEEVASTIVKARVVQQEVSLYTAGFLNLFWVVLGFLCIAFFVPGTFVFSAASFPTFVARAVLEIAQAHMTIKALATAARSGFTFIRTLTVPLLLLVDFVLGYTLSAQQMIGIGLIVIVLIVLFMNHGVEGQGREAVLFIAINAVITLSLYKYHITYFNSVIAEQLLIMSILSVYFFINSLIVRENPFLFLKKKIFFLQSVSMGIGTAAESFAFVFAPASIITAAKRSGAVLWSIVSGHIYFHEKHLFLKVLGFIGLVVGIIFLAT